MLNYFSYPVAEIRKELDKHPDFQRWEEIAKDSTEDLLLGAVDAEKTVMHIYRIGDIGHCTSYTVWIKNGNADFYKNQFREKCRPHNTEKDTWYNRTGYPCKWVVSEGADGVFVFCLQNDEGKPIPIDR